MTQVRLFWLFSAIFTVLHSAQAQISTITQFTPDGLEALPPLRAYTPDEVACANGHCYAITRQLGASYRPDQAGSVWSPLALTNPKETLMAIADAGNAVLFQSLETIFSPNDYQFHYRLYRTTDGPSEMQLVKEILLSGLEGLNSARYGKFKVINEQLIYFSLEISSSPYSSSFKNYVSTDGGKSWTGIGFSKNSMATTCQVGSLYVLIDFGSELLSNPEPDSLYWSLQPEFTAYNATAGPKTSLQPLALLAQQDSLFLFDSYYNQFYFSAYGGLDWQSRPLPVAGALSDVVVQQGQWYFATSEGMYRAASPTAAWTPVYRYQDCFDPGVQQLYTPENNGLPWLSGAGSALLRPADPQGAQWSDFSTGLPGEGTRSFKAVGDTLYSPIFQSADGLHWQPMRSPGLRGAGWMDARGMTMHQGHLFAPARLGDYTSTLEAIYVRPNGADWSLLDTADSQGYSFGLASGSSNLYWYNSKSLRRSTDLGQSWLPVALPAGADFLYTVPMGDTLFVVGYSPNRLWRSTDQGQSWQTLAIPTISGHLSFMPVGKRLVLAGDKLVSWTSTDLGDSWQQTNLGISSNYSVGYEALGDILVAHLSSQQLSFYRGVMLSLDGGAHWLKLRLPESTESNTYYGFAGFKAYFYFGHYSTGNWRFPDRLVLQKLEEITPKVPAKEPLADSGISLSPNPASTEIWLRAKPELPLPLFWQMFDVQGRRVLQGEMDQSEYRISLAGLANGLYWLHFPTGNDRAVPVLVQH